MSSKTYVNYTFSAGYRANRSATVKFLKKELEEFKNRLLDHYDNQATLAAHRKGGANPNWIPPKKNKKKKTNKTGTL